MTEIERQRDERERGREGESKEFPTVTFSNLPILTPTRISFWGLHTLAWTVRCAHTIADELSEGTLLSTVDGGVGNAFGAAGSTVCLQPPGFEVEGDRGREVGFASWMQILKQ